MKRVLCASLTALAIAAAVPASAHQPDPSDPDRLSIDPRTENIEVIGRLQLPDLRDNPEGGPSVLGRIADVNYWGDYAYLGSFAEPACDQGGVYIVDISDPTAPTYVTFIPSAPGTFVGEGVQVLDWPAGATFQGQVLLHSNEDCSDDFSGLGGMSLWDVTDPTAPAPLVENAGDSDSADPETGEAVDDGFVHTIHSIFGWVVGDSVFAVTVDNDEAADIDLYDITDPTAPVLISEVGYRDDEQVVQTGDDAPNGDEVFSHDMVVEQVGEQWLLLMSYWDGGEIIIDVTDPAAPTYLRDVDFPAVEPLAEEFGLEIDLVPEGNAHQADFNFDASLFMSADEDFNPFRLPATIASGPYAGAEFTAKQAGDTLVLTDQTPLSGPVDYVGRACSVSEPGELVVAPPSSEDAIALVERGICTFQEKLDTVAAAGYSALIVFNSLNPDCLELVNPAAESEDVPFLFVDRATGLRLLGLEGVDPETACTTTVPGSQEVRRLSGEDRIATAIAIAEQFGGADTVLIARSDEYADALVGGPLAAALFAPILLTGSDTLDPRVGEAITALGATSATLLGGTEALSAQVEADVAALDIEVARVGAANRFGTAADVAAALAALATEELPAATTAFVVEGGNADPLRGWPDALAVSPLAGLTAQPILLTMSDELPEATAAALEGFTGATIVGGAAAVDEGVESDLAVIVGTVDRLAGDSRFSTSAAVAAAGLEAGLGTGQVFLASGGAFPDALAAGPLAALFGATLLLVPGDDLAAAPAVSDFLAANAEATATVTVLGGTDAVSEQVAGQVDALYPGEYDLGEVDITPVFDGWGYMHLYDAQTMQDLDQFAIPEAADPAFATGYGDLSVHEVETHPSINRAYVSYYGGGFRVLDFSAEAGLTEVGAFVAEEGSNFWGVQVIQESITGDEEPLVLASDRDFGLYVFRYTGP